ncbi:acyl-CoA dehydrogenase family protein [Streptomyces rubellomurinus]|uniref:Acyl-CoA dehydrogenase n=1 Tax=Streptomyces rubellomurinus (strain ATCC 31215) TaxID=359131 RepID=A0A0F2TI88_STRR3|nr:acyl-CoA dehydrogenase family protein [Streptomyces rubellomurinus]KJS62236.1 acyl-CoA dehydrogenase [Streptomyces rubellomurinus]
MDFDLTAAQRMRREAIAEGVRTLSPGRLRAGPDDHFDRADWAKAAELGLTGLCLPVSHGGGGLGALDTALCLEAFGEHCPDTGLAFGVAAHLLACGVPVAAFATPETRDQLLLGMADGTLIAANAMTEAAAGSDVGRLDTTATVDGEAYVLDGVKTFASNAPLADVLVSYATTDRRAGFLGISAFAVPCELPGVAVGDPLPKMGLWGCPAGEVRFDACAVPERYRLGEEGQGSAVFQHSMRWERSCLPALYLGLLARQLQQCTEHAGVRRQFGREIGKYQAVSHRVARMRLRLEGARLLLYRACWLLDHERHDETSIALSKTAVSEAAVANSLDAVQIFGGAGYLCGGGIEAQLRDSIPATLFSGTTEIQSELIAREAGL